MAKAQEQTIAASINKGRLEHTCHPNDTVFQALSKITSTHETVFVLDDNDKFLGLLSPYQILYQHRSLHQAKVSAWLIHPPYLTVKTLMVDAAGFMASLKTYTLPVFDDAQRLIGYIRGGDLLRQVLKNPILTDQLSKQVSWREPITARIDNQVKSIFSLLRSKNIARVVLVDDQQHLKGIVARSDLQFALMTPSDRQRFRANPGASLYFDDAEAKRLTEPVSSFAVADVLTADSKDSDIEVLKKMLQKQIHSIVQIDAQRRPTGFLSRADFLLGLRGLKAKPTFPLLLSVHTPNLQEYYSLVSQWYAEDFADKHHRQFPLMRLKIHLTSSQNTAGKPSLFSGNFSVTLKNGQTFYAKTEHHWFKQVLIDGLNKLDKQLRRSN